jgi:hypothetical protein
VSFRPRWGKIPLKVGFDVGRSRQCRHLSSKAGHPGQIGTDRFDDRERNDEEAIVTLVGLGRSLARHNRATRLPDPTRSRAGGHLRRQLGHDSRAAVVDRTLGRNTMRRSTWPDRTRPAAPSPLTAIISGRKRSSQHHGTGQVRDGLVDSIPPTRRLPAHHFCPHDRTRAPKGPSGHNQKETTPRCREETCLQRPP